MCIVYRPLLESSQSFSQSDSQGPLPQDEPGAGLGTRNKDIQSSSAFGIFTAHRGKSSLQYQIKSCWREEYPESSQVRNQEDREITEEGREPHKGGGGCVSERGPRSRHLRKPGTISHTWLGGGSLGPRAAAKKDGQHPKGLVCQARELRL